MSGAPGEATVRDPHLSDEQIAQRAAGQLPEIELDAIERHLSGCDECRARLPGQDPLADTRPAPLPPTPYKARLLGTFNERYELKRVLGTGGMGTVYEALDMHLHRLVALKLLRIAPDDPKEREEAANRMVREARAMAVLSHRNVVTVYDVGLHGEQVFVAMQLVVGTTLRGWLAAEPRELHEVLTVMRDAGAGLAAAHRAGLVHRDFKPDNVLISKQGTARVTDFGLARRSELEESSADADRASTPKVVELDAPSTVTRSGLIVGTPAYMAPEQVQGQPSNARADQFSFCVATWEALFGKRPFAGVTWSEIYGNAVRGNILEPADGRRVPRPIVRALRRGLSANAADRFSSMDELLVELEDAIREPARRRRRWQWVAVFGVGAVAATAISVGISGRSREDPPPPPVASSQQITVTPIPQPAEPVGSGSSAATTDPVPALKSQVVSMLKTKPTPVSGKDKRPPKPQVTEDKPVSEVEPPTKPEPRPDARIAELAAARSAVSDDARKKGLLSSDLPAAYHAALASAAQALEAADVDRARGEVERARAALSAIVIDQRFVNEKMLRINKRLDTMPADRVEALKPLKAKVMATWKSGDLAAANSALNEIAAQLK